ncbi:MAG TPA: PEP/pyruvate-binding domain-containing protein [Blastocatellia bacterium]|nr:PEP/pyruvate-binding domain-containing protein [Blastocatellia bacterium]
MNCVRLRKQTARAFWAPVLCLALVASASGSSAESGDFSTKHARPVRPQASLERINSRAEFDQLARVYYRGRFQALPHVMFVVDRRSHDRVYYINSRAYQFHKDFVNATYLSLERGRAFYDNNYLKSDRRFILGTIAYHQAVDKFAFEFWEGDRITAELLAECYSALRRSFYAPVFFKPTSKPHQEIADALNNAAPSSARVSLLNLDVSAESQYQPLNLGSGIGQLRIIERLTPDIVIDRNQIVIFKEVPVHLTPLSGIITTQPASPLSHANMLAKSWAIPSATIKDADLLFKQLEGKYVRLEVRENDYSLAPADPREVDARNREWVKRGDLVTPRAELSYAELTDLSRQRAKDARRFGAKSANLGEVNHARLPGMVVPRGFTIPFHYYQEFIRRNRLEERIAAAVEEDRFVHDPRYRKTRLAEIRQWIERGEHDPVFQNKVLSKVHREYAGLGLFARSSTNAEDLPNFSGAGLYSTVPNVRTDDQLMDAIKTVWASIWNYEAYEARESFGMNHFGVYPAVLIQEGIDADSAGVAITTDPFNLAESRANGGAVYVNAKRGLGIKVVEGRRVAEQVIYRPGTRTIQVLTRSDEDTMLAFDEHGGVKEVTIEKKRRVLTDEMVRRLARASIQIKRVFGGRNQDIEWLYRGGQLYIVQSRPYIQGD